MDALICYVCGDTMALDRLDVVAAAQIVIFVDAHCVHDRVSIDFCDLFDWQAYRLGDRLPHPQY